MGFSNKCITPRRRDYPHIVFMSGLWRVSPLSWKKNHRFRVRWNQAHEIVRGMNERLLARRRGDHLKRSTLDELL